MEIPINCDNCDLMTVEGEYGEPTCPFGLVIRCASKKHPACPLRPSAQPHGNRYFEEADAELKDAARSGKAFIQWEALRQIALNLARIADSLEEKKDV